MTYGVIGNTSDFGSVILGSSPSRSTFNTLCFLAPCTDNHKRFFFITILLILMIRTILIVFVVFFVVGFIALYLLFRMGESTEEDLIATYKGAKDEISIHAVSSSSWGNSYRARVFRFNNRLIDFKGNLLKSPYKYNKFFPIHQEDQAQLVIDFLLNDQEKINALQTLEFLQNKLELPKESEQIAAILAQYPELEAITPFTLWIEPSIFSKENYESIKKLLSDGETALINQQKSYKAPSEKIRIARDLNDKKPLYVWRIVYYDPRLLKSRVFTRQRGEVKETLTINVGGDVEFRHESKKYVAGYGTSLGQLNASADTIIVYPVNWSTFEEHFPIEELADFRNEKGLPIRQFYAITLMPNWETDNSDSDR